MIWFSSVHSIVHHCDYLFTGPFLIMLIGTDKLGLELLFDLIAGSLGVTFPFVSLMLEGILLCGIFLIMMHYYHFSFPHWLL